MIASAVMSSSDLAKIGYLYLRGRVWEGKQIVSREWVQESLKPLLDVGNGTFDYGLL
jgi:CubicO group peptidase (beta-lactamase class C family)